MTERAERPDHELARIDIERLLVDVGHVGVLVVAADGPVEPVVERLARQAKVFGKIFDSADGVLQEVPRRSPVGIDLAVTLEAGIFADRRQRDVAGDIEVRSTGDLPEPIVAAQAIARGPVGKARVLGIEPLNVARYVDERTDRAADDRKGIDRLGGLGVTLVHPAAAGEGQAQSGRRLCVDRQASPGETLATQMVVTGRALLPGAALTRCTGQPDLYPVGEGAADISIDLKEVEPSIARVQPGAEILGRLGGDVVDQAARRVLAEDRTLRAFQNLDPLEIEGGAAGHDRVHDRYLVDVHADRGRCRQAVLEEADAAQRVGRGVSIVARDGQARDDPDQILRSHDVADGELGRADRADRHADIVEVLRALLRRHDDVGDPSVIGLGSGHVRCRRWCRVGGRRARRGGEGLRRGLGRRRLGGALRPAGRGAGDDRRRAGHG